MAWSSNGFFRNVSIAQSLTLSSGSNVVQIYQPGTANPTSLADGVRYAGFITSLRLYVDISSIAEVQYPTFTGDETEAEMQSAIRAVESTAEKKQVNLLLRKGLSSPIKIGHLWLYNRRPYYTIDLLLYFTDAAAYDVASDTAICLQMASAGYALLGGTDVVTAHGSAVEEGENTAPVLNVYVVGSGTITDGGGGNPGTSTLVTDNAGSPVTNNAGEAITNA